MKTKIIIALMHLMFGSLCLAAGYITNENFNEMIESVNQEQQATALIMSPTTGQRTPASEYTSKNFGIRDHF